MTKEFIRWLLDGSIVPNISDISDEELLDYLKFHRLEKRVVLRMERTPIPMNPAVYRIICEHAQQSDIRLEQQISFLQEVSKYTSLFVIKGCSAYLHTMKEYTKRYSRDIDCLSNDIPGLCRYLNKLGFYSDPSKETDVHEEAILTNGVFQIEVHNTLPPIITPPDIVNSTVKKQFYVKPLNMKYLHYEDVSDFFRAKEVNRGVIYVPSLEMTAFIRCIHLSKKKWWEPFLIPSPRLFEIFELNDLMSMPSFKYNVFMDIANKYNAQRVVQDALILINSFFDIQYGGKTANAIDDNFSIVKLMSDSFGPYWTVDRSVYNNLPLITFEDYLRALNAQQLSFDTIFHSNDIDCYIASSQTYYESFSFKILYEGENIVFYFYINHPLEDGDSIFVKLKRKGAHIHLKKDESQIKQFGSGQYEIEKSVYGYTLKYSLPQNKFYSYGVIAVGGKNNNEEYVIVIPFFINM